MNRCLKNIQLQLGFNKTVTFGTDSLKPATLEILRNGAIIKAFAPIVDGDFLGSDFSSEFGTGVFEFLITKSEIQKLFDVDRFFDFRLVVGGELLVFGGVQVFDNIPDCKEIAANVKSSDIIEISQSENTKHFDLPDIDVKPLVEKTKQISDFFAALMAEDGYI